MSYNDRNNRYDRELTKEEERELEAIQLVSARQNEQDEENAVIYRLITYLIGLGIFLAICLYRVFG